LPAEATREDQDYRRADWGPEAALAFCEKVRDLPVKSGGNKIMTIGDLIDVTPKEQINKVRLEEKIFETWHYGRTVLIGDGEFLNVFFFFFFFFFFWFVERFGAKCVANKFRPPLFLSYS
jgi:hypothetical protein